MSSRDLDGRDGSGGGGGGRSGSGGRGDVALPPVTLLCWLCGMRRLSWTVGRLVAPYTAELSSGAESAPLLVIGGLLRSPESLDLSSAPATTASQPPSQAGPNPSRVVKVVVSDGGG